MAVCVLIPAYNAGKTLGSVISESMASGLTVLVVNDGSYDDTETVARSYEITLLRHEVNRGKGAALTTGFAWALENGFDGVVTLDADGQHDPSCIGLVAGSAVDGQFGILIASRFTQFEQMAGLRKVWNRFGVWCMRKKTGFEITDSQSGFRYYSAHFLSTVSLSNTGYDLEMELLMKAWRGGFTIGSLPVPARVADGRATSHFRPVRDTFNICMTFLKYM